MPAINLLDESSPGRLSVLLAMRCALGLLGQDSAKRAGRNGQLVPCLVQTLPEPVPTISPPFAPAGNTIYIFAMDLVLNWKGLFGFEI
jgi:hypothetical protein